MDGVASNESKNAELAALLAVAPWLGAQMALSTYAGAVDATTAASTILGGEITVAGYARQTLTGWSAPTQTVTGISESTATPVTFLNRSGADSPAIYSWIYVDLFTGHALLAGSYPVPFVLPATIGSYTTTPYTRLGALAP